MDKLTETLRQLYSVVAELEKMFPGLKFTPDGNMVGNIGEAIARTFYGVALHRAVHPRTDGVIAGREVQVKTTQGSEIAIKLHDPGDLLLVIKLNSDGTWERIYDGDSERVWTLLNAQKESYMREKTISLKRLRELQKEVSPGDRISLRAPTE